jgi:hypothetical protein
VTTNSLVLDCPECGSAGSVHRWSCEICESEAITPPLLHPSIPLRFADVVRELRTIAQLASGPDTPDGPTVARACRRAESLLLVLRRQFVEEVVLGEAGMERRSEVAVARS